MVDSRHRAACSYDNLERAQILVDGYSRSQERKVLQRIIKGGHPPIRVGSPWANREGLPETGAGQAKAKDVEDERLDRAPENIPVKHHFGRDLDTHFKPGPRSQHLRHAVLS
jgi:hypothetical protein